MTNPCAAFGSQAVLLVQGGAGPRVFSNTSERYPFLAETLTKNQPTQGRRIITGTLDEYDVAIRQHSYIGAVGAVVMHATPAALTAWLPRILGGTSTVGATNTVYDVGFNFPTFDLLIDRENGVFHYTDLQVAKAVFRSQTEAGQQGENEELVEMILYLMGRDETYATAMPATLPTLSLTGKYSPYAHFEGTMLLNTANDTRYRQFELGIDNKLQPIFNNSLTPDCFRSAGRTVSLDVNSAFVSTSFADALAMIPTGLPGSLTFTNGLMSTLFEFGALRNSYKTPNVRGKGEVRLEFNLESRISATNAPSIRVTNDDDPLV